MRIRSSRGRSAGAPYRRAHGGELVAAVFFGTDSEPNPRCRQAARVRSVTRISLGGNIRGCAGVPLPNPGNAHPVAIVLSGFRRHSRTHQSRSSWPGQSGCVSIHARDAAGSSSGAMVSTGDCFCAKTRKTDVKLFLDRSLGRVCDASEQAKHRSSEGYGEKARWKRASGKELGCHHPTRRFPRNLSKTQ
jgi:hypothetical protein